MQEIDEPIQIQTGVEDLEKYVSKRPSIQTEEDFTKNDIQFSQISKHRINLLKIKKTEIRKRNYKL